MSIQLVLYPQNYQGYSQISGNIGANLVADGQAFTSAPLSQTVLSYTPYELTFNALNTLPPVNNWQSFYHNGITNGITTAFNNTTLTPEVRFQGANLGSSVPYVGIYQRIDGMIPGQQYELRTSTSKPRANTGFLDTLQFGVANATSVSPDRVLNTPALPQIIQGTDTLGPNTPITFTALDTYGYLVLQYASKTSSDYLGINNVEIRATAAPLDLYDDGQVICDLYNEQEIPITLSIDSFTNAGEKQQSYSKNFNLPATKHNNNIFEYIFEITKDSMLTPSFNPYKQTRAIYKQNGITIFDGYLRLINVQEKKGERSYNVNLYSKSTSLAEILKAKKFSDLSNVFMELTHKYNRNNIQDANYGQIALENPLTNPNEFAGPVGATTTSVLRYPFCDWTGNINASATQIQIGNGATEGMPSINRLEDVYRPWLNVKYLWQNIFAEAGFTYQSQFVDSVFGDYYMDFNWGGDESPMDAMSTGQAMFLSTDSAQNFTYGGGSAGSGGYFLIFPSNDSFPANCGYDDTTGIFTATSDYTKFSIEYDVYITLNNANTIFIFGIPWTQFGNAQPIANAETLVGQAGDIVHLTGKFERTLMTGDTIAFFFNILTLGASASLTSVSRIWGGANQGNINVGSMLNTLRGDLGQWEFIKGLITMFNLVVIQDKDNPTNLIIEPYQFVFIEDWLFNPTTRDWTEKVDIDDTKLEPLKLKQTTTFQYAEDKDYPFSVYKSATGGYNYGSLKWQVPEYTLVTGEEKIEATPFAATVMKPIFDFFPNFIAPAIYSANDEGTEFTSFENKPRILYNVSGDSPYNMGGLPTFYTPYQNGTVGTNAQAYNLFSHTSEVPSTNPLTTTDLNFGACQFINGMGTAPTMNLFMLYYQSYFEQLYHPDTRTIKVKLYLTENDIDNFEFYDRIMIRNRKFRVNKINYKPDTLSVVELILLPNE